MKQQPKLEVKSLKKHWVMVSETGNSDYRTISLTKKDAIEKIMVNELVLFSRITWDDLVNLGYRCIKVNIEFKPTK